MSGFFSVQVVSFFLRIFMNFVYCRALLSHSPTRAGMLMDPPQQRHSAHAMAGNSVATSPETELSQHKGRGSAKLPPNKNRLIEHLNVTTES